MGPSPSEKRKKQDPAKIANDEEVAALQAALAESQLAAGMAAHVAANEVLYNDGATPLFAAIEETKWTDAMELLDVVPEQAGTWVKSTGTENTTFGWSLWRRLPIQEACRRQAPAWLVAALLKAKPQSVTSVTQFGELPLHLAVEMGCAPEVVNLLIVTYYEGIQVKDNSGRTPLQIAQGMDVVNFEAHSYILDSLLRASTNLANLQNDFQYRMNKQEQAHNAEVARLRKKHKEDLEFEREQQRTLQKQIARLEGHIAHFREERKSLERTLNSHHVEKGEWKDMLENREEAMEDLITKIRKKDTDNKKLTHQLQNKTKMANYLQNRVQCLEQDLVNITTLSRDSIMETLRRTEDEMYTMLNSHQILQGKLQGQTEGLSLLLSERGIKLPPPPPPPKKEKTKAEIEAEEFRKRLEDPNFELEAHMNEVTSAAAEAAVQAINHAQYEKFEQSTYEEITQSISEQSEHPIPEGLQDIEEKKDDEDHLENDKYATLEVMST